MIQVILAAILAMLLAAWPAFAAEAWMGRAVRVIDANTLDVARESGEVVGVRLYGVDAPEMDQPLGNHAVGQVQFFTLHGLEPGIVKVEPVRLDIDGRLVAKIEASGLDLGYVLSEQCLAWADMWCFSLDCWRYWAKMFVCRWHNGGIWYHPNPIPPREWRKGRRN